MHYFFSDDFSFYYCKLARMFSLINKDLINQSTLYVHLVLNGAIFPQILYDIVP